MDEGVDDEMTAINAVDGTHVQCKDNEYSIRADSGNMLESHEVIIPGEGECHDNSPHIFETILEDKNFDRTGVLEHQYSSSHCMDAGIMVEELTLRNYEDGNLGIVGTSNNKERFQTRQNQWQHLYQIAGGGSGSGSSHGDAAYRDNNQATLTVWENMDYMKFPDVLSPKPLDVNHNEVMENSPNNGSRAVSGNKLSSPGGIHTKMLSKSGFCEYFVKNTLKGKGIVCKGPARKGSGIEFRCKIDSKAVDSALIASDAPLSLSAKTVMPPSLGVPASDIESRGHIDLKAVGYAMVSSDTQSSASANTVMTPSYGFVGSRPGFCLDASHHGINLRDWLKARGHKVNKVESLYIFKQILDIVERFHSEGVVLKDIRPSFFTLLPSNRVLFLGSSSGKGITEDARNEKRPLEQDMDPAVVQWAKKHKFGENMNFIRCHPISSRTGIKFAAANDTDANIDSPQDPLNKYKAGRNPKVEFKNFSRPHGSNTSQLPLTSVSDMMEEKWYASLEELSNRSCTFSSNIYSLGVLLFELLGSFDSGRARDTAMSDLHHRILPPSFLSENPKEAGFCLWLLHPETSSRPTAREILQSDMINGIQESCGDDLSPSIHEDDTESELLLHFLVSLKEQKQKDTSKLVEEIKCLEADIEEAERQQNKNSLVFPCPSKESPGAGGNKILDKQHPCLELQSKLVPAPYNELNLMRNISQLESAYFSMRSNNQLSDCDATTCTNKELLTHRQNCFQAQKDEDKNKSTGRLGAFFNGLCKYARYSKFEVRGLLRNGDFSTANVICSLSFDRDEDYFAAAGVSKKIKIYEFHALFNDTVDIHYPVIEMSNKSKLSCICWNNYIRNYLASTDYDGVVKLWDAGTGQEFSQYTEHTKRAWSVDFSQVDPTRLASGSDDCFVKLWSINAKNSFCTVRNIANVCCVQFSPYSTHLLAFGSADYKTYCYDLRNASSPFCILAGHDKTVSYVKFLDSETLVSASTDNTLKLWDLNKTSSSGPSTTACTLTLRGHTNEKNFVGLSVSDGYIACGSETNEVYAYYRSLPMPVTSHKFGSVDPVSGKDTEDDNGQFVSSVCWRRKSDMVVAANSSGCIKVLQMV